MHSNAYNFFITLKWLYIISAVVMKGFTNSRKLFYAEIITVEVKVSVLLNVSLHIRSLTFINEALHLSGGTFVVITSI